MISASYNASVLTVASRLLLLVGLKSAHADLPDDEGGVRLEGIEEAAQCVGGGNALAVALLEQERQNTVRDAL